jgi:hypothetical protein
MLSVPDTRKPREVPVEEVSGVFSCKCSPLAYAVELTHPVSLS